MRLPIKICQTNNFFDGNTTIGYVITNAKLGRAQATKLAASRQNYPACVVRPTNSIYDGDSVFTMCTGEVPATLYALGILAAGAVEETIIDAVKSAEGLGEFISIKEMNG